MSEGRSKILKKDRILEVVQMLKNGLSHQEIADKFSVGRTTITRISSGARWTNITGGPVCPVNYVNGIKQFSDNHRRRIGEKRKGKKHTEETKLLMSYKAFIRKNLNDRI